MKRVLVTGANGFVGSRLIKELADNNVVVTGIGGTQGTRGKPRHIADYKVLNLTKPAEVKRIDFSKFDGVIHLAGLAAVGPSFDAPTDYINQNTGMQINLFEAALAQNARPRFLIISSGSLYDPSAKLPLTEASPVAPSSPYAVSKLTQELMARYYGLRGFEYIIVRPFNHIGPGQKLGFIVPDLTKQFVEFENNQLSAISVGNLDAKRDYTDVRDIVRAYRLLLEKGQSGETYNICSGTAISGQEILSCICEVTGTKPPVVKDSARLRPSDSPVVYGSHAKITKQTGWKPEIPLETTIRDVVKDWRSRSRLF